MSQISIATPPTETAPVSSAQHQQLQHIYTQNVDLISHNFKLYDNKGCWISERTLSLKYQGAR